MPVSNNKEQITIDKFISEMYDDEKSENTSKITTGKNAESTGKNVQVTKEIVVVKKVTRKNT